MATLNSNPIIFGAVVDDAAAVPSLRLLEEEGSASRDPWTAPEVFDLIRHVRDPEHEALTLEQLRVATPENIRVDEPEDGCESPPVPSCVERWNHSSSFRQGSLKKQRIVVASS